MDLFTITEVSRLSGISRTSLYRLKNRGRLDPWIVAGPSGRPLLRADVIPELKRSLLRGRVDSPWLRDPEPEPDPAGADDWETFSRQWGRWEPGAELTTDEFWAEVARLARALLADPLPPITGATAPAYVESLNDAVSAVTAGFRWDAERWAAQENAPD